MMLRVDCADAVEVNMFQTLQTPVSTRGAKTLITEMLTWSVAYSVLTKQVSSMIRRIELVIL